MGSLSHVNNIVWSFSEGLAYHQCKMEKECALQGKDRYPSLLLTLFQLGACASSASSLAGHISSANVRSLSQGSCVALPFVGTLVAYILRDIKNGRFNRSVDAFNANFDSIQLPRAGKKAMAVADFFDKHSSDLIRASMIVSSIALVILGERLSGVSTLISLAYGYADEKKVIPKELSRFIADNFFIIVSVYALLVSSNSMRALNIALWMATSTEVSLFIQRLIVASLPFKGSPSLFAADAELKVNKNLSFQQIQTILTNPWSIEVNPAHCHINFKEKACSATNRSFYLFGDMFDAIDWNDKYVLLSKKLFDDDLFLDFLKINLAEQGLFFDPFLNAMKTDSLTSIIAFTKEQSDFSTLDIGEFLKSQMPLETHLVDTLIKDIQSAERSSFTKRFPKDFLKETSFYLKQYFLNAYLEKAAASQGLSKEAFVVDYTKKQLSILVDVLEESESTRGSQKDLQAAQDVYSRILPLLANKELNLSLIEKEDLLIKLAIEGGAYCARGILTAGIQALSTLTDRYNENPCLYNPSADYELNLQRSLQEMRLEIFEEALWMEQNMLDENANIDTQMQARKDAYSLGFIPLSQSERAAFNWGDSIVWALHAYDRNRLYDRYRLFRRMVFKEEDSLIFTSYIRQIIYLNTSLTVSEKKEILDLFVMQSFDDQTNARFQDLVLVTLGVFKFKGF